MDHFNATVFNGSMIATRRGFQVSKQKHRGTAFVNSSVKDVEQQESTPKPAYSLPIHNTQLTFITNSEDEKKLAPPKRRTRRSKSPSDKLNNTGIIKPKRRTRFSPIRRQSSCSSSSTSSEGRQIREMSDLFSSESSTSHKLRSLPPWACYKLQTGLPDSTKRLLFMCLAFSPSDSCYDDCADIEYGMDSPERDMWRVQDPTSLHCATTLGALFDAMRSGKRDSPELVSLTSQLSFIINRRLNEKSQDDSVRNITIHAVATLAILAGYLGKHDHWHVHTSGLLRLIDMAGGQNNLDNRTITTIRKADLVGAISAVTKPRIPFMRRRVPLRCPLPITNQEQITRDLTRHLSACGVEPVVASAIAEAAGFNRCVSQSLEGKGNLNLDADVIMEHYYALGYKLLSEPEPLRQFDEVISPDISRDFVISVSTPGIASHTSQTWQMGPQRCAKAIESAMRILTLMYLREPILDLPCGDSIMFSLLEEQLRAILVNWGVHIPMDLLIDPLLLQDSADALRPTLIWICLAGDLFATLRNILPTGYGDRISHSSIYHDLLRQVLGPQASANPDLVPDTDFEVCRLLDLGCLTVGQQTSYQERPRRLYSTGMAIKF